ncbi:MAG: hypothetical protein IKA76_00390 [Clostridia bacterium]|nr:hypothetical protein [Clostridia bacterium]
MIKSRRVLLGLSGVFVAAEVTLGVLLQVSEGRGPAIYSYAAVILACLFFVLFFERTHSYVWTQLALLLTVCADYFLVWSEEQQKLPAMVCFLGVQLAYGMRLWMEESSRGRMWQGLLRGAISVFAMALTWMVLGENADALALVSMVYYANLFSNLLCSAIRFRERWLLSVGFFLFLLCDTVIGLSMLGDYLSVAKEEWLQRLLHPGFNLAWVFYLPSQVCLALSLLPLKIKKGNL